MRHNLLASTALTASTVFVAGAAWGADLLPVKAPPVLQPLPWNTCYAGANAGALSGLVHQEITLPGVASVDTSGRDNWIYRWGTNRLQLAARSELGARLGSRYQLSPV